MDHSRTDGYAGLPQDMPPQEGIMPAIQREYRILSVINEVLSHLLSREHIEEALEQSFKLVCETIGCDGVYLFDYQLFKQNTIASDLRFGLRFLENKWTRLPLGIHEFPMEITEIHEHAVSMIEAGTTTVALRKDCPPQLQSILKEMDVESYMSFRITIDGKVWGNISFVSREPSIRWTTGLKQLLTPLVSSVGNYIVRKETEKDLRQKKHFAEMVTAIAPDTILVVHPEARSFTYTNLTSHFLGFELSTQDNLFEFLVSRLHPDDRALTFSFLQQLNIAHDHEVVEKYFRLQHQKGHWLHFYERARVFSRHPDGTVKEYLAVLQDITEKVKAQRKLEESEQKYRNFIEHSFDGIYYLRLEQPIAINMPVDQQLEMYYKYGYIEECNVAFARMYGCENPKELIGLRIIDAHGGADFEYNKVSTRDFINQNYSLMNSETIEFDVNGNKIYILNHAFGDIKDGYLHGVWGTQQNITERRKAKSDLKRNQQLLKGIIDALPDLKFRINKDFVFLDYYESENENEPTLVPPSKFLGKRLDEVLPDSISKVGTKAITTALKYKTVQAFEYFIPINGELNYYEGRVSPINEEEVILAVRNISEGKKAQIELKEKLRELDEKNKQLTRYIESNFQLENFAYIASHDLREPVRTMHSFAQLLQRNYQPCLDEKGKNYVQFIIQGAENMNRLIEDLLTYSRVSSEEAVFEAIDLPGLVQNTVKDLTSFIREYEAKVYLSAIPVRIIANRTRIKQLFQNLLINAIKFHRDGVTPEIHITGIDHGRHWLFEIKDNGMGVPANMQDIIFQLFKKIHYHQSQSGTGIGLALCKRIIEQHGGEIWVESKPGKGSSFYFTIEKQLS